MESIKIGTNLPKDKVSEVILSYPFSTKLNMHIETLENRDYFIFNIDEHRSDDINLLNSLASLVQSIIIKLYMKDLINSKVSSILQEFAQNDIDEVENTVFDFLLDEDYFADEKSIINSELKDYLLENNALDVDGYLRFRSKSFESLIDKIIDKVITDIQMEEEYEDFVQMLQYYLDSQIPKVDIVNVIIKNKQFFLLDQKKRPIESSSIKSIVKEFDINDISKADVLVSTLIVLAPNKVIIHLKNDNEKELMQILKKIFTNKLSFCYSCELCDMDIIKSDIE